MWFTVKPHTVCLYFNQLPLSHVVIIYLALDKVVLTIILKKKCIISWMTRRRLLSQYKLQEEIICRLYVNFQKFLQTETIKATTVITAKLMLENKTPNCCVSKLIVCFSPYVYITMIVVYASSKIKIYIIPITTWNFKRGYVSVN